MNSNIKIDPTARINVEHLEIGEGSCIGAYCKIEGKKVIIGRDFWMDEYATIGGGSCWDECASLEVGDFFHMGRFSHVNIGRPVTIGNEVGFGPLTQVYAHGAYLNELEGFPVVFKGVEIGSNVWLPQATVLPGTKIGDNVVVAAGSLVNQDIPNGSLAGGVPIKILKRNCYPKTFSLEEKQKILVQILSEVPDLDVKLEGLELKLKDARFNCKDYIITGPSSKESERLRNQLRRHGIRFRFSSKGDKYIPWID